MFSSPQFCCAPPPCIKAQSLRRLGPLTLVVKGETIPEGQSWTGSPAVPWHTCRS
ncbi:hypothetical protein R6242_09020 [Iodobacter sp. CM08]|uniref:hypothetical protein n=1 Tax=Iodobacter sp. CM08 TaxID=3085902 RepID=UPI00298256E4|nr:hypothetical protein [Iodobacter sp. CM08]MDW5416711.1 hypothetical protein [Iodobacter sp. CM08]